MNRVLGKRVYAPTLLSISLFLAACGGEPGVVAHKFQGSWTDLPTFESLTPVGIHIVPTIGTHSLGSIHYGIVLKGLLKIDVPGQYKFHLRSDDGSRLSINGETVIENDGIHTERVSVSNNLVLAKGEHEISVEYFQYDGAQTLALSYQLNGGAITPVSENMLSHKASHKEPNSGGDNGGGSGGGGNTGGGDTPTSTNSLQPNESLNSNQYLASSNGQYRFYLQSDGNLVLRDWNTRESLWSSGTHGQGGTELILQSDGNLVLYTASGTPVWSSNTQGSGGSLLVINNDGSFAIYAGETPVWAVNDSGNSGGGSGGGTSNGVKIAFIGDTGTGSNFQNVLNLIKQEGAELTVVAGDTSYDRSRDDKWDSMVRNTLGSSDPALVVAGNHDYEDSNFGDVRSYGEARLNQASNVNCSGSYAEKMTCRYKNIYLVMSAIGSGGSRSSHESYISDQIRNAPAGAWRICAWHKNQRDMQVGGKSDEVGWTAYETCRQQGAIISTGHEHSYSRTHLLSDMSEKSISSTSSTFTVAEGKTFAFVSGLGGIGIRDQERSGNWWAKVYTSTQNARYGAMFGTFYEDRADFYFKNINGQVIDQFTVMKGY